MATGKQLKAAILARRAAKGPRKKRMRPEPRQYTVADLERARDRVAAAERRIDNDRSSNPNRGRAGLERAQLELSVIESQLRLRGLARAIPQNWETFRLRVVPSLNVGDGKTLFGMGMSGIQAAIKSDLTLLTSVVHLSATKPLEPMRH